MESVLRYGLPVEFVSAVIKVGNSSNARHLQWHHLHSADGSLIGNL